MTARSIRRAIERKRAKQARKAAAFIEPADFALAPEAAEASPQSEAPSQNRLNAQLSTGPRTPEGKHRSSMNALRTGLTGRTVLLHGEDADRYARYLADYQTDFQPVGQRERDLVQSIADINWRLQRIPSLESALYVKGQLEFRTRAENSPTLNLSADVIAPIAELEAYLVYEKQLRNLHLQESRLARRHTLQLAELDKLQTERRRREQAELEQAATLCQAAEFSREPFDPLEFGFEISLPQIKRHIALRSARKTASISNFNAPEVAKSQSSLA